MIVQFIIRKYNLLFLSIYKYKITQFALIMSFLLSSSLGMEVIPEKLATPPLLFSASWNKSAKSISPHHQGPSFSIFWSRPQLHSLIVTKHNLDIQHIFSNPANLAQGPHLLPAARTEGQLGPLAFKSSIDCCVSRLFSSSFVGLGHHDLNWIIPKLPLALTVPPSPLTSNLFILLAISDLYHLRRSRGDSSSRMELLNSEALRSWLASEGGAWARMLMAVRLYYSTLMISRIRRSTYSMWPQSISAANLHAPRRSRFTPKVLRKEIATALWEWYSYNLTLSNVLWMRL